MARPRKDSTDPSARQRIESAFWEMLMEGAFDDITIRGIASRAGVNHNTFYRHYENTRDLASKALDEVVNAETARYLAGPLAGDLQGLSRDGIPERFSKVRAFARSGSSDLERLLASKISSAWLDAFGIRRAELSPEESIDLDLLFGIVVMLLGDENADLTAGMLEGMLRRDLGCGMRRTLAGVIDNHRAERPSK